MAEKVCGPRRTVVVAGRDYSTVSCLSPKPGDANAEAAAKRGIDVIKPSCLAATGEGPSQLPKGSQAPYQVGVAIRRIYTAVQKSCPDGDRAFVNIEAHVSACVPRALAEG
jgi:hypothetical protein